MLFFATLEYNVLMFGEGFASASTSLVVASCEFVVAKVPNDYFASLLSPLLADWILLPSNAIDALILFSASLNSATTFAPMFRGPFQRTFCNTFEMGKYRLCRERNGKTFLECFVFGLLQS
ncbi:hypothetical protein O6H91_Y062900 [Diphasiastrum complanatum]|nr:hypothetical protein O6H91_Y062900 [Diphasiastrum complanatum]